MRNTNNSENLQWFDEGGGPETKQPLGVALLRHKFTLNMLHGM